MVEVHASQLEGKQIRYNGDTWAFTGDIEIKQNGSLLEASAHKSDRIRGTPGILQFQLENPPASINPGNLGSFDIELNESRKPQLHLKRAHSSNDYSIKSLRYD